MRASVIAVAALLVGAALVAFAPAASALPPTPGYYSGCPSHDPEEPHPCDPVVCDFWQCTKQWVYDVRECMLEDAAACVLS
ncbi:MAG TPA: hypothetical protein VNZ52_15325 [Candidatus Thermoplasmatota archaeon]|nr:hypothetical protein [Candidatus Thermoplasmatota archaeon]